MKLFLLVLIFAAVNAVTWYPDYLDKTKNGTLTIGAGERSKLQFTARLASSGLVYASNTQTLTSTNVVSGAADNFGVIFDTDGNTYQYTSTSGGVVSVTIYGNATLTQSTTFQIVASSGGDGTVSLFNVTVVPTDCVTSSTNNAFFVISMSILAGIIFAVLFVFIAFEQKSK